MRRATLLGPLLLAACSDAPHEPTASDGATRPLLIELDGGRAPLLAVTSGAAPPTQILEVKGGGLALFDLGSDGDLDLFVPDGATLDDPSAGAGARVLDVTAGLGFTDVAGLGFTDVTDAVQPGFDAWGMGVAAGDLDGNGSDDLFVCAFGPDAVLLQTDDGRLPARIDALAGGDAGWSSGAALGDLDRDGDLDVYVARYLEFDPEAPPERTEFLGIEVFGGPFGLPAVPDRVWRNAGDGSFVDVAAESGALDTPASHGLGAVVLDLDDDGWLDVYVGNDSQADFVLLGREGLRFEESASRLGLATNGNGAEQATMGIAVADVNDDGAPDLFTTNFAQDTNTLRVSTASGRWRDGSLASGLGAVSRPFCGWSADFADLDLDGALDLLVFNGHVYPETVARRLGSSRAQAPLLFLGRDGRFERASGLPALERAGCDRGAVLADLDGDGDVDAVSVDICGPLRVLENTTDAPERALVVELTDSRLLGTRVTLVQGDRRSAHWFASGTGYQSSGARQRVFGVAPDAGDLTLEVARPGRPLERRPVTPGERVSID